MVSCGLGTWSNGSNTVVALKLFVDSTRPRPSDDGVEFGSHGHTSVEDPPEGREDQPDSNPAQGCGVFGRLVLAIAFAASGPERHDEASMCTRRTWEYPTDEVRYGPDVSAAPETR
jgi:hypothetical protein